jgi:hypothetical protein
MSKLRYLSARHTLPFCTTDGRIVSRVGHDAETGIYLHLPFGQTLNIPDQPTRDQVSAALATMMAPLPGYTWATSDDAGAAVCSTFMAICRPVLEICPAVLVDASSQGSGKTKLAMALGALMTGRREGVLPFSGIDDDELRKQLISGVIVGQVFVCLDNVTGFVRSPTLAAVLTSGRLQGRVLGASKTVDASIRALVTLTANNASIDADLQRRVMKIRIDSGANPTHRRFSFCPVNVALSDRFKIAEAACVIWRAYFNAGAPRIASDDAGGFTQWSNLCRQPVLWLQREGLADRLGWQLGDPAASMLADPSQSDPEFESLGELLRAIWALTEGAAFKASDMLTWFRTGAHDREPDDADEVLHHALRDLLGLGGRDEPNAKTIGRALMNRRERVVGGLQLLVRGSPQANAKSWRVAQVP